MKIRLLSVLILLISTFSLAQNKSSIDFEIRNLGITVDGHFNDFTIKTNFSSDGTLEKIEGRIEVKSIETGIENRDEHLLEEEYFNVIKHQFITLISTKISKKSSNKYEVLADLTIKGKTKKVTIPALVQKVSNGYKVTSTFEINRKDFSVGGSSFTMSKTVELFVVHYQNL